MFVRQPPVSAVRSAVRCHVVVRAVSSAGPLADEILSIPVEGNNMPHKLLFLIIVDAVVNLETAAREHIRQRRIRPITPLHSS
jgi:hypothetical protein